MASIGTEQQEKKPVTVRKVYLATKKRASALMAEGLPVSMERASRLLTQCQEELGKKGTGARAAQVLGDATVELERCIKAYRELEDKVYDILVRQEKGRKIEGAVRLSWQASAHKRTLAGVDAKKAETDIDVSQIEQLVSRFVDGVNLNWTESQNNTASSTPSALPGGLRSTRAFSDATSVETEALPDEDGLDDEEQEDPRLGHRSQAKSQQFTQREKALDVEFALELSRSAEVGHPTARLRRIWAEDGGYDEQLTDMLLLYLEQSARDPSRAARIECFDDDDEAYDDESYRRRQHQQHQQQQLHAGVNTTTEHGSGTRTSPNREQQNVMDQKVHPSEGLADAARRQQVAETLAKLKSRNAHESAEACRKLAAECEGSSESAVSTRRQLRAGGVETLVQFLGDVARRDKRTVATVLRFAALDDECARQALESGALNRVWSLVASQSCSFEIVALWKALSETSEFPKMARMALGQDPASAADVVSVAYRTNAVEERLLAVEALVAMAAPDPGVDAFGSGFSSDDRVASLIEAGAVRRLVTLLQKEAAKNPDDISGHNANAPPSTVHSAADDAVVDAVTAALLSLVWRVSDSTFERVPSSKSVSATEGDDPQRRSHVDLDDDTATTGNGSGPHNGRDSLGDDDEDAPVLFAHSRARIVDEVRRRPTPPGASKQEARDAAKEVIRVELLRMSEESMARTESPDPTYVDDIVSLLAALPMFSNEPIDLAVARHCCRALPRLYASGSNLVFERQPLALASLLKLIIKNDGKLTADLLYAKTEAAAVFRHFAPLSKNNAALLGTDDAVQALVDCCHHADPKNHTALLQSMLLALHGLVQHNPESRDKFLHLHGIALLRAYLIGGVTCLAHEAAINMLGDFARDDQRVKLRLKNDPAFCRAAFDLAQQGGDNLVVHQAAKNLLPVLDIDVPEPTGHLPRKPRPGAVNTDLTSSNSSDGIVLQRKKPSSNSPSIPSRLLRRPFSTGKSSPPKNSPPKKL